MHGNNRGVRRVILRTTSCGSRQRVSGWISAKTGIAPTVITALAVAMNEYGGTITSSPSVTPIVRRPISRAVVPLVQVTANLAP